jgi:hypothetical protein
MHASDVHARIETRAVRKCGDRRMRPALPAILSLVGLLLANDAGAQACGDADRDALQAVVATGGTLDFSCSGTLAIDETLVVDGASVTLIGPGVSIARDALGPPIRLFEVRSGSLTLDGISLREGQAIGASGADGAHATDGTGGLQGGDGAQGVSGAEGEVGGDATEAESGGDGENGRGGAIAIDAGAVVTLRNCFVSFNAAVGGGGGDGGQGGRGGGGGPGGNGGGGPGINAGNGGLGANGGTSTPGGDGGHGGSGFGGAIDNQGALTIDGCTFQSNSASGGIGGNGAWGGNGGHGGTGGFGGASYNTEPMFPNDNTGLGGRGGKGGNGTPGADGGDGGNGGGGFGGAIFNTGTLVVADSLFRSNVAAGFVSGFGASAGVGGAGGDGRTGGQGKPGGVGGDGGHGSDGAAGGDNGDGGGGIGGAIYSTVPVTLANVTFQNNLVSGAGGGSNTCTPGDFQCFGAGGTAGLGGNLGLGGANVPLGSGQAANGTDGADGAAGFDGEAGAFALGVEPDCWADGDNCLAPEPDALASGALALAACAGVRRGRARRRPP